MIARSPLYLLVLAGLLACGENAPGDDCAEHPTEELAWLKNRIEMLADDEFAYISQAVYQGQTVFVFGHCCETCSHVVPVRDCEGETLGVLGFEIAVDQLDQPEIIWEAEHSSCHLPT